LEPAFAILFIVPCVALLNFWISYRLWSYNL